MLPRLYSPLLAASAAAIASAGALLTAYIAEYGFGYFPCTLCLWQRGPLWAALAVVAIMLLAGRRQARIWLGVLAMLFAIEAGIAAFHVGVEQHWWEGTASCSVAESASAGGADAAASAASSLREQLLGTPVARCDQVTWTLFGFSMAGWNVPFSLLLALWMLIAAIKPSARRHGT